MDELYNAASHAREFCEEVGISKQHYTIQVLVGDDFYDILTERMRSLNFELVKSDRYKGGRTALFRYVEGAAA